MKVVLRAMKARHSSICNECRAVISIGQQIVQVEDKRWIHTTCFIKRREDDKEYWK